MNKRLIVAAAVLALGSVSGQAWAESEGGGAPWVFQATSQTAHGGLPTVDVGSEQYPAPANNLGSRSSLAQLKPAPGSETLVETASSLPRGLVPARAISVESTSYQEAGTPPQYG